jgi:tRNA-dihydrouridine synthase
MKLMCAPMQGFTEAPFRHFHAGVYGAADCYFSPFLRVDHGAVRGRDLRDVSHRRSMPITALWLR